MFYIKSTMLLLADQVSKPMFSEFGLMEYTLEKMFPSEMKDLSSGTIKMVNSSLPLILLMAMNSSSKIHLQMVLTMVLVLF